MAQNIKPADPAPVEKASEPVKQKPTLSDEEVQRRIAQIRRRRKRLEAELKKCQKIARRLDKYGYDFFQAAEDRYLDPER